MVHSKRPHSAIYQSQNLSGPGELLFVLVANPFQSFVIDLVDVLGQMLKVLFEIGNFQLRKSSLTRQACHVGQKSGLYISAHDDSVRHDSRVGCDILVGMMVTHDDTSIGEMLNMTLLQIYGYQNTRNTALLQSSLPGTS